MNNGDIFKFHSQTVFAQGRKIFSSCLLCWVLFVSWTHARVTWEEGTSAEEMSRSDGPVAKSMGAFS